MKLKWWLALAAFALLGTAAHATPAPDDPLVRDGPHFRLVCHLGDERIAAAALETVEAIWPLASGFYGFTDAPLDPLLEVHLYRDAAAYRAAEQTLALGAFGKNLAFSSYATRAAYVALQPDLTDETLAAVGLTTQTRHLLAHEAAHLVRFRASPAYRSHPGWFGDGAAIWIEEETMLARGWSAGLDEDPYVATDAVRVQKLAAGGHLPTAENLLRDDTKGLEMYDRYAARKLLFRRLVSRRDGAAFRAAAARALQIPAGPDHATRFFDTITEPYRTEGLEELHLDYERFVRTRTPAWDETLRSLSTTGDAWTQIAFPELNALAWRRAPLGEVPYEVRGELEILPCGTRVQQMNVLLGRADDGFVSVAFVAGWGVDVMRYHSRDNRWEKLATAPSKIVLAKRRLPFRVAVEGQRVSVRLDGNDLVAAAVKDHSMAGPWGLGVQAGGAGFWRGVRAEALKAK